MNIYNNLLKYYRQNTVFVISFIFSIITYLFYLYFRGFGWDGDSFISASQFVKIINHNLYYATIDGGAHPKLFTVIIFGAIYQVTGGFYLLTFISIIINALMISSLTNWIYREKGIWLIALFGLLINIPWTKIVINCDNTAFSIPLIVIGLYLISKDKYYVGALLLIISNFFRTGSEFVIFILIIYTLYQKKFKHVIILGISLSITLMHSYWGYLLVYPSREIFWNNCWAFRVSPETIAKYQYSIKAIIPYLHSIFKQLLTKYSIIFIIPAILGLIRILKNHSKITLAILIPLGSLILPVSTFLYGTILITLETKHMGYTILLPVLAAFSFDSSIFKMLGQKTKVFFTSGILLLVILFSAFTGKLKQREYEAHINGTGTIGWTNFPNIKKDIESMYPSENITILTAYQYLTFITLDIGKYANNIDVVKDIADIDYNKINSYDLIIIPNSWNFDINKLSSKDFRIKNNLQSNYLYLFKK